MKFWSPERLNLQACSEQVATSLMAGQWSALTQALVCCVLTGMSWGEHENQSWAFSKSRRSRRKGSPRSHLPMSVEFGR